MQIQITRTPIWVTNDAGYYLATSDCKLKRQGLSIWPFQIQRGEEEDITTHLWAKHLLDINSCNKQIRYNSSSLSDQFDYYKMISLFLSRYIWDERIGAPSGINQLLNKRILPMCLGSHWMPFFVFESEKTGKPRQFWRLVKRSHQSFQWISRETECTDWSHPNEKVQFHFS